MIRPIDDEEENEAACRKVNFDFNKKLSSGTRTKGRSRESVTESEDENEVKNFFLLVPQPRREEALHQAGGSQVKRYQMNGDIRLHEDMSAAVRIENTLPLMDEDPGGISTGPEFLESDNRFNRFNYSMRSAVSDYSIGTSTAENSTWTESDEAKSSMVTLLSALYALVLVILSLAFEISVAIAGDASSNSHDIFYCYLYLAALLFFLYCEMFLLRSVGTLIPVRILQSFQRVRILRRDQPQTISIPKEEMRKKRLEDAFLRKRKQSMSVKRKASHSASSAGSLYLRMGCVVFGVVGLIMKGLLLFAAFDRRQMSNCFSGTWVAETVLSAIFIFVQMFFIFQNTKLIIHRFKMIGRLGAMHLVATNLSLWIRSILKEQMTIMHEINHGNYFSTEHQHKHATIDNHTSSVTNESVESCASVEARFGFNSLIADVEPFTTTCIVEYSLICAAVMYILWRNIGHKPKERVRHRKQRFHVDCSSSTQGLFMGLFFMVYTIVSMVIFFTKVRSGDTGDALCVFYTTYIVLFGGSIVALLAAMHRMRKLFYLRNQKKNILLDDILLIVGLIGQLMFCIFSVVPLNLVEGGLIAVMIAVTGLLRTIQVLWQTVFIFFAQRLATTTPAMQAKNPGREMVTFLLIVNLALFLINIFEIHKAGTIPHSFHFYGEGVWIIIAHSTVPLCIFYRFHSTVCLAEIWKLVYRVKEARN